MRTILVVVNLSGHVRHEEAVAANKLMLRITEYPTDLNDLKQGITLGMPDLRFDRSNVVGDKEYFRSMLEITGYDPSDILYVDDRKLNLKIAHELGFHTLKYDNPTRLALAMVGNYRFKFDSGESDV